MKKRMRVKKNWKMRMKQIKKKKKIKCYFVINSYKNIVFFTV